jgi:hypothetical protein
MWEVSTQTMHYIVSQRRDAAVVRWRDARVENRFAGVHYKVLCPAASAHHFYKFRQLIVILFGRICIRSISSHAYADLYCGGSLLAIAHDVVNCVA